MRSMSPDWSVSYTLLHCEGCHAHLVRVKNINGSPCPGSSSIPQFRPGIFFPDVQMEYMVIPRPVICYPINTCIFLSC